MRICAPSVLIVFLLFLNAGEADAACLPCRLYNDYRPCAPVEVCRPAPNSYSVYWSDDAATWSYDTTHGTYQSASRRAAELHKRGLATAVQGFHIPPAKLNS